MTPSFLLLFAVIFLGSSQLAFGQSCEIWAGEPAICAELPGYQANVSYIWTAVPQNLIASFAANDSISLLAVKSLARECYLRSLLLLCSGYLPPCVPSNVTEPLYVELLTCSSVCEEANVYCQGVAPAQDCKQLNPLSGKQAFPDVNYTATYGNVTFEMNCATPSASYLARRYNSTCAGPLRNSPLEDGTCGLRCPVYFYSEKEWYAYIVTMQVVSWLGIVGLVVVLVPFLIIRERRAAPIVLQTWLLCSIVPLALVGIMPSFDPNDIICRTDRRPSTWHFAPCTIQGIFLQFAAISGMSWCMWLMFDAMFLVLTSKHQLVRKMFPFQAAFSVSVAVIYIIVTLATHSYESSSNTTFCFIKSDDGKSVFKGYDSFLFWMPLGMFWAAAVLCWVSLFAALLRRVSLKRRSDVWFAVKSQLRLMAFVGFFFLAIGSLFLYRFTQKPKGAKYSASYENFVGCWAIKAAGAPISCPKKARPGPPYAFDFISANSSFSIPVVFCIILGAVPDVRDFYAKLWGLLRSGSFNLDALKSLTERSTTGGGTGTGSSRSGADRRTGDAIVSGGGSAAVISHSVVDEEF